MPTLADVRTRVDNWLAGKWPTIVARQDNFYTNRGRYWQGVKTHTFNAIPRHMPAAYHDSAPDQLVFNVNDAFDNWKAAFPEWDGVAIAACLSVDVYDGPNGKGWCATVWAFFNGKLYSRSHNVGPESWRTKAWAAVPILDV
jgi:hypothetical protein